MDKSLLIIHVLSCFFLTGLIWTIQVIHYPSFMFVDKNDFQKFHEFHSRRITLIVLPLMTLELCTAGFFAFKNFEVFRILNFLSVIAIWISTGLVSVPIHNKLVAGKEITLIRRLVTTNWYRTILWTIRSSALIYFIFTQT